MIIFCNAEMLSAAIELVKLCGYLFDTIPFTQFYFIFSKVSENLLSIYLDEYEETPWDALKYLIAGVNYGGHVTDDYDRRLLHSYINTTFTNDTVSTPFFKYVKDCFAKQAACEVSFS